MGIVKISDGMHENLRTASVALSRSINAQAEHWMRLGMLAELYPDLDYRELSRLLIRAEQEGGLGHDLASAAQKCPRTVELLNQIPSIKAAMFASLPPGARLVRHRDPYAGSLRYHLGLRTPNSDQCRIFVDGEMYSWKDGEAVMFDETYIHRA